MKTPYHLLAVPALFAVVTANSWATDKIQIDDAARKKILATLSARVSAEYVFPDKAKLIVERLNEREKGGAYRELRDPGRLAAALTSDLRQPTHDLHLDIAYSATPVSEAPNGPRQAAELERVWLRSIKAENFGVRKVESLPGNIGYIDLGSFAALRFSRPAISAAMTLIADTDALIIDLRNNFGGDPSTVAYMSSYLFDKRTHLNDLYWRRDKRTVEFWTRKDISGKKFGGSKKVYVLTSRDTFSAAEEFSYNLKQLRRATIVGETTGGGAHPGQSHQIHPHLSVFIPGGRAINPVSKTNWEGTGVMPDVRVGAADALRTAERLAVKELLKSPFDDEHAQLLRTRLDELNP
jgi:hypothetical protein